MRENRLQHLILLFCFVLLFASADAQDGSKPKPVEVATPERGKIQQKIAYTGHLEAEGMVEVFAGVSGKIVALHAQDGDAVNRGDAIAVIDTRELQLGLKQAKAAQKAAEAQLQIVKATTELRIRTQLKTAEASLDAAQAQLAQAEVLSEVQTQVQFRQAEAGATAAAANLEKARLGARTQEIEQAKAAVAGAKAGLENARANFTRVKKLHDNDAISDQNFDSAKAQVETAEAQHAAAVEQLSLVEAGVRDEDITAAEAQFFQADASRQLAELRVDTKDWQTQIRLAASQVQQAFAGLRSAKKLVEIRAWEHDIAAAQSQYDQATAQVNLAEKRLADATITAPIDGIVVNRSADVGDYATAAGSPSAEPILTIVKMDVLEAIFSIPEVDLGNVSVGSAVGIATRYQQIQGKIDFIAPIVNPEDRSVQVKASLLNLDYRLKPGMFVEVDIDRSAPDTMLLLPRSAILDIKDGVGHVFVAIDGLARQQSVKVSLAWGEKISILEGISDSTQVIVSGHRQLADGMTIRVVE